MKGGEGMTVETIFWTVVAIVAACSVGAVWLVFWVTQAPIMELHCQKCGVVDGCDDNGNCLKCGLGVELRDRGGR